MVNLLSMSQARVGENKTTAQQNGSVSNGLPPVDRAEALSELVGSTYVYFVLVFSLINTFFSISQNVREWHGILNKKLF